MTWKSEKDLMLKLIRTLKNWRAVCKNVNLQDFDHVVEELTTSLHQPLCIAWDGPTATFSSSQTGLQSGLAPSTGQEAWNDTTTPSTPEETPNESSSSHRYVPWCWLLILCLELRAPFKNLLYATLNYTLGLCFPEIKRELSFFLKKFFRRELNKISFI